MHPQNGARPLYLLIGVLLVLMGAEYWFLGLLPKAHFLYLAGLKGFAAGGFWLRLSFCLLYPLGVALAKPGEKRKAAVRKPHRAVSTMGWLGLYAVPATLLGCVHLNPFYQTLYPAALLGVLLSGFPLGKRFRPQPKGNITIQNDTRKQESEYSFHLRGRDGSWVNIVNPFRGVLVVGGAGSGKTYSVAEPIIAQAAGKGYAGVIYDFKFPTLTDFAYTQYSRAGSGVTFWVVNFEDMEKTHRVNPLNPKYMPSSAYASEYALAIINNLLPESIQKPDFWIRSAQALLTATIWYLKKHHPEYCTLPHVVNLILSKDYEVLLELLGQDSECAGMVRSIITAVEQKASNQIAGMISSLQVALARINSPEICYVLSGDEFDLDINCPERPKLLCIGSSPTLSDTFSPLVSCLITVAIKLMNQQQKRHSFILLDEGPTVYIPKLDMLPATARSNKVATIYMQQDFSQSRKEYGQNESEALISNLNNQFFGRVANLQTAEYVSRLFGREERLMRSESVSDNRPRAHLGLSGRQSEGSTGTSVNYSFQERFRVQPQDLLNLEVGQFLGSTVETVHSSFLMHFKEHMLERKPLPVVAAEVDVGLNYRRVIKEVQVILQSIVVPGNKINQASA